MDATDWQWDPTLYSGSAAYYSQGRVAYPRELADRVAEASRRASSSGTTNVRWLHLRAEDLPAGLGRFRLVSFAQSFHWLDRLPVARPVHGMLDDGGACVHVGATTHTGVEITVTLPYPQPPRPAIAELVLRYLGTLRRAGQGTLPTGTASGEGDIYRAAGFTGPHSIEIPGYAITRTVDDLVAALFSLSSSAPHLFGDRRARFEAELRQLLFAASSSGVFSEQMREIAVDNWRK